MEHLLQRLYGVDAPVCRTMSRRRWQTYNKEEVLAALFALSSDDESENNLEDSEDSEDGEGTSTNSLIDVDTDDDDDILYQLIRSDQEGSDTSNSFLPDDVIKLFVEKTNLYAHQCQTRYWNDATCDEIKCFLGILLGM